MLALLLLSVVGTTFAIDAFMSEDDDAEPSEESNEQPETEADTEAGDDEAADLGASFSVTDTGVSLELGEDETGSIAVVYYTDTEDTGYDVALERDEARYYLVPEDVDFSGSNWETRGDIPGTDSDTWSDYQLADFEETLGLELLGVVDLMDVDDDVDDPSERVGVVETNTEISGYYLAANTDGDDLVSFLPTDYVVTVNGVTETVVTEDTVGSDGFDWLGTGADGITVDGGEGDDFLVADNLDVTIVGGAGDDDINTYGTGATRFGIYGSSFTLPDDGTDLETGIVVDGGAGDDRISSYLVDTIDGGAGDDNIRLTAGTVMGGTGDDTVYSYGGDGPGATVYGEEGDDRLIISGGNSEAYGGVGDDFVSLRYGATGYGGEGGDTLQVDAGTTSFGGDGDDTFNVYEHIGDEDGSIIMTGGDGADTFNIDPRRSFDDTDAPFAQITDFDIAEDVLVVGTGSGFSAVVDIEIVDADDGSYSDVNVTYTSAGISSLDDTVVVIRLDGDTGITADHIVIDT